MSDAVKIKIKKKILLLELISKFFFTKKYKINFIKIFEFVSPFPIYFYFL